MTDRYFVSSFVFFFLAPAPTEIYTLSLHDALPIFPPGTRIPARVSLARGRHVFRREDRKSTRLNSSHQIISYAVFCLKKKKKTIHRSRFLASFSLCYSTLTKASAK